MEMIPKVVQAVAGANFSVYAYFHDGTVAWDIDGTRDPHTCIDLDPCDLYESCPVVEDPLKEAI